jgi:hypothetical protein
MSLFRAPRVWLKSLVGGKTVILATLGRSPNARDDATAKLLAPASSRSRAKNRNADDDDQNRNWHKDKNRGEKTFIRCAKPDHDPLSTY